MASPATTNAPTASRAGARSRWPVAALAIWNGYVFGTRIANVLADASASAATKTLALALAVVMLAGSVALVVVLVVGRGRPWRAIEGRVVQAVAALTTVVWVIRGVEIATADYSGNAAIANPTGFKVVHLLLGVVSIVLAALAWRAAGRATAGASVGGSVSPAREPVR